MVKTAETRFVFSHFPLYLPSSDLFLPRRAETPSGKQKRLLSPITRQPTLDRIKAVKAFFVLPCRRDW
jgi:hypothetical protein